MWKSWRIYKKNNKLILKLQKKFRSEKYSFFSEQVNKIALSPNNNKRIQSIYSIETYGYQTTKDLICKKEEIKCNNITKRYKMIDFDNVTKENIKEHNPKWSKILDHPHRILLIGDYGCRKINALINLMAHQPDIDKIYLYTKNPYDAKYK